jgi:hypothetical protein
MEQFRIRRENVFISDFENKIVHADYYPDNLGADVIMHGAEICFKDITIEQALLSQEESIRLILFTAVNQLFPGMYQYEN